jgi:hypothetical protein
VPEPWIDALFARFKRIWAEKWTDHVQASGGPADLAQEWREGLAGMSGDQIKTAIEYCREKHAWPPSIAEFRAAASGGSTPEQRVMAARLREADQAQRALPAETWADTKARGTARLSELKEHLREQRRQKA